MNSATEYQSVPTTTQTKNRRRHFRCRWPSDGGTFVILELCATFGIRYNQRYGISFFSHCNTCNLLTVIEY